MITKFKTFENMFNRNSLEYAYLDDDTKESIKKKYYNDFLDIMLNNEIDIYDNISNIEQGTYEIIIDNMFDNDFYRMIKDEYGVSNPEFMNTMYDIKYEIYIENKTDIINAIDEKVVKYFKANTDEYINAEPDFPSHISDRLEYIKKLKEFNL